jgi:fibronectin-binding autotransporter adhesin
MVQTYFPVTDEADFDSALTAISNGGTAAAINTSYTIALTGLPIGLTNDALLDLETGSTLLLEGAALNASGVTFTATGAMTLDLNFTGTITLDGGSVDNVALTTNSGGTVTAGYYTGQIVGTPGDGGDTAINDGTITFSGASGAVDFDTGLVQNGWDGTTAALISGTAIGVEIDTSGTVQNAGTISAFIPPDDTGIGVYLGAGTVDNGTDTHNAALITADDFGVEIIGTGLVDNDGTISGAAGAGVYLGSGTIDNGDSADITATITSTSGDAAWVGDGTGIVANFGTISASGGVAVYLEAGGTLTNGSTADTAATVTGAFEGALVGQPGSAFAGTIDNYGTITANGDDSLNSVIGVFLENGGSLDDLGTASAVNGVDWGVLVEGAAGSVQNAGTISASGTAGLGVDLTLGGTVDNVGATATIDGTYDGVRIAGGAAGAGALVDNQGTIIGAVGVDFATGNVEAAGTVVNDGLIESTTSSGYAIAFGDGNERLILQAGGSIVGSVQGYENASPAATTTIEFATNTSGTFSWSSTDSGSVADGNGSSFNFASIGTFVVDAGASWGLQTDATSAQTIQFQLGASPAVLALSAPNTTTPNAVQAVIEDFGKGGTIDLPNVLNASITGFNYAGSTLDVLDGGGTLAVLDLPGSFFSSSFTHSVDAADGTFITTDVIPCFLPGTRIRTDDGDVPVEELSVGDKIVTLSGEKRPLCWIGTGSTRIKRGERGPATPIIIREGALGPNIPHMDLRITKGHSLYLDGVLIPAEFLVNHHSIYWDDRAQRVTVFHLELDTHDVLIANGAAAESYRDDGNRRLFRNANTGWSQPPKPPYAPVLTGGPLVDAIWRRLLDRVASRPGLPVTDDPDLHLLVNGRRRRGVRRGTACVFDLPSRPRDVRIVSRAAAPQELGLGRDPRRLGVAISRIALLVGGRLKVVAAGEASLKHGFHAFEPDCGFRWTDGDAWVPPTLFEEMAGPGRLELTVASAAKYKGALTPSRS